MPSPRDTSNRRQQKQKGSVVVEASLTFLIFIVLILGIMDFGRIIWTYTTIAEGAREATRYAIVHGASSGHQATVADIQGIVTSRTIGLSAADLTTTVTFTPDQTAGSTAKVAITYNFRPVAPYIPSGTISLKSTSQMVINQ